MKKITPILLLSTSVNAGWFNFNQEEWVGFETDIPNTSYDFYYGENLTPEGYNNGYFTDIVNSTTMKLYKGDMWIQTIWGVSFPHNTIPGVYESFEYWDFRGAGHYTIVVEVYLEHNDETPYGCNLSSDCYIASENSYVERLTDTLKIVILENVNDIDYPLDPPVVESKPEILPALPPVAFPEPLPGETQREVTPQPEKPLDDVIVINTDDWRGDKSTGSMGWFIVLLLIVLVRVKSPFKADN